jgi:hypothetical protein
VVASRVVAPWVVAAGRVGEQAERAFFLEVHGHDRQGPDPPDPASKVGNCRARRGVGQHPQAERERCRADVVALLDRQREGNGIDISLAELSMPDGIDLAGRPGRPWRRGRPGARPTETDRPDAHDGKQPERFPVAQHPWRDSEPLRSFRDAHDANSNKFLLEIAL